MADSSQDVAHSHKRRGLTSGDAEGSHRRTNSKRKGRTNDGAPGEPRGQGNPRRNSKDQPRLESVEAIGRMARDDLNPTEMHGDGGASQDQTQFDVAATGYSEEKRSLGSRGGPTCEGEISTRNPNPSEAQSTWVREGNRSTHDISTINTGTQHGDTQGKFDSNSGSYNNYGDEERRFATNGPFINTGRIEVNFGSDGAEGLRNTGRCSISHFIPLYRTSALLTSRNVQLQRLEKRGCISPGWSPIAKTRDSPVAKIS